VPKRELAALVTVLSAALLCGCRPSAPVGKLAVSPAAVRLGYPENAPLHFAWSPFRPLENKHGDPTVFVHVLDRPGSVKRTFDHPLPVAWTVGTPVAYDIDVYQSALASSLPPGKYLLSVGLYDSSWGYRWALETGGPDLGKREYRVGTLDVPPAPEKGAARFDLTGGWGPTEPDPSVQVLARRRLNGPASLTFEGSPGSSGSIRLALTVRRRPLEVEGECGGGGARRFEPGYHWIGFDLPAGGRCGIQFREPLDASEPKDLAGAFSGAAMSSQPATSLDVASWRPGAR
jgi:hypothetical protein